MNARSRLRMLRMIAELHRERTLGPVVSARVEIARIEAQRATLRTQIAALSRDASDLGYAGYAARSTARLRATLSATAVELARRTADLNEARDVARSATARVDVLAALEVKADDLAKRQPQSAARKTAFRRPGV